MMEKPILKTLKNGLRVVYIPFPGIDSVTFRLLGRAGALWEKPGEYGLAHFLEHLAFDGTEKYPEHTTLVGKIKNIGGYLNASTSDYRVSYKAKVLKSDMEVAFDVLSQQLIYPLLREEDIERQRGIITQEYHMYRDDPLENFQINSDALIYNRGSRLQSPVIGELDVIKSLKRDNFVNFMAGHYVANNFVLSICGDSIEKDAFHLAEKYFGVLKEGTKAEYTYNHLSEKQLIYAENNDKVKQSTISIIYKAPQSHTKDSYPSTYVANILGGGFISRLFNEIRQKRGLAYHVSCRYFSSTPNGYFEHIAGVEPGNIFTVLGIIKDEIEKLVEKGVTEEEFERSKKSINANFSFRNESPDRLTSMQGHLVLEDQESETMETVKEKLLNVTIDDINEAARKIYKRQAKVRILSNDISEEEIREVWEEA